MSVTTALLVAIGITTISLLVMIGVLVWVLRNQNSRELKYIHWAMSRTVNEFNKAQATQATIIAGKPETIDPKEPAYTPETALGDDEWFKKIRDINSQSGVS